MKRRARLDRVRAGLLAGGIATGLLATMAGATGAVAGPAAAAFHAPRGERLLTRVVSRELGDGTMLVVRRRYAVRFTAIDGGFLVDGRQIDVEVDAPARIGALAAIERGRRDEAMFPIRLDREGYIVAYSNQPPPVGGEGARHAALRAVEQTIGQASFDSPDRQQALETARVLTERVTAWPRDLFRPGEDHSESRAFALPDGSDGSVTVAVSADMHEHGGSRLDRVVTTVAGGERRTNTESWLLEVGNRANR